MIGSRENLRRVENDEDDSSGISLSRHYEIMGHDGVGDVKMSYPRDYEDYTPLETLLLTELDAERGTYVWDNPTKCRYLRPARDCGTGEDSLRNPPKDALDILLNQPDAVWANCFKIRGCSSVDLREKWPSWVHDVYVRFEDELLASGIRDAVGLARYKYAKDVNFLRSLCSRWCPVTNTFFTTWGEISISLHELVHISGLPVVGAFYDEFIPFNIQLYNSDTIPACTRELFHAYNDIATSRVRPKNESDTRISHRIWMNYFFTGKAGQFSEKAPKGPFPSNDEIRQSPTPSRPGVTPKGYLAAFLATWLSAFVLPSTSGEVVRPETFVMAGRMAMGIRHNLAVPVLASIYKALRDIVYYFPPGAFLAQAPLQYLYGWIAMHFPDTYAKRVKTEEEESLPCLINIAGVNATKYAFSHIVSHFFQNPRHYTPRLSRHPGEPEHISLFTTSDNMSLYETMMMLSLRPGTLLYRQGLKCICEPYYPCRFGRQEGYAQCIPPMAQSTCRETTNLESVKRKWFRFIRIRPGVHFTLIDVRVCGRMTTDYAKWWISNTFSYLGIGCKEVPIQDLKRDSSVQANKKGPSNERPKRKRFWPHMEPEQKETPPQKRKKHRRKEPSRASSEEMEVDLIAWSESLLGPRELAIAEVLPPTIEGNVGEARSSSWALIGKEVPIQDSKRDSPVQVNKMGPSNETPKLKKFWPHMEPEQKETPSQKSKKHRSKDPSHAPSEEMEVDLIAQSESLLGPRELSITEVLPPTSEGNVGEDRSSSQALIVYTPSGMDFIKRLTSGPTNTDTSSFVLASPENVIPLEEIETLDPLVQTLRGELERLREPPMNQPIIPFFFPLPRVVSDPSIGRVATEAQKVSAQTLVGGLRQTLLSFGTSDVESMIISAQGIFAVLDTLLFDYSSLRIEVENLINAVKTITITQDFGPLRSLYESVSKAFADKDVEYERIIAESSTIRDKFESSEALVSELKSRMRLLEEQLAKVRSRLAIAKSSSEALANHSLQHDTLVKSLSRQRAALELLKHETEKVMHDRSRVQEEAIISFAEQQRRFKGD